MPASLACASVSDLRAERAVGRAGAISFHGEYRERSMESFVPAERQAQSAAPAEPVRPAATKGVARNAFSVRPALAWAAGVALLLSVQFLIQPFVWVNWPWDEVVV